MSEQINATCTVCGNGYHMCLSCKDKMKLSPWKMYTDTAEHFKIHQIIHGFSTGVYGKDEVRIKLKNVDLSDLDTFKPNIKSIIKDILKEEKPIVKIVEEVKPVETMIVEAENNVVVENVENIVEAEKTEDIENVGRQTTSRKRNYKVEE